MFLDYDEESQVWNGSLSTDNVWLAEIFQHFMFIWACFYVLYCACYLMLSLLNCSNSAWYLVCSQIYLFFLYRRYIQLYQRGWSSEFSQRKIILERSSWRYEWTISWNQTSLLRTYYGKGHVLPCKHSTFIYWSQPTGKKCALLNKVSAFPYVSYVANCRDRSPYIFFNGLSS